MAETGKPNPPAKPKAAAKKPAAKKPTPKNTSGAKRTAAPKPKSTAKPVAARTPSKGKTDQVKAKVRDDINDFRTKATDGARAAAERGKDRATEAVSSIGKLIRDSAATIDDNVGKQYGDYARNAAASVDGFASKMDAKDVDAIVNEAREFVRKSPAVAIGAAAAIGFVLARLVRSGRDA